MRKALFLQFLEKALQAWGQGMEKRESYASFLPVLKNFCGEPQFSVTQM